MEILEYLYTYATLNFDKNRNEYVDIRTNTIIGYNSDNKNTNIEDYRTPFELFIPLISQHEKSNTIFPISISKKIDNKVIPLIEFDYETKFKNRISNNM